MKKEYQISDFSPHLFWDVDRSKLDLEKNASFLIERVLEYGVLKDWELIKKIYGLEAIKTTTLQSRSLDDVTLSFLCSIFDLTKDAFRCYKLRQSSPHYWNY